MIRGRAAWGMYWGAVIITVVAVIGVIALTYTGKETPNEITMLLTAAIGFIFGTRTRVDNLENEDDEHRRYRVNHDRGSGDDSHENR